MTRARQILLLTLVATTLCVDLVASRQDRRQSAVTVRLVALARGAVRRSFNAFCPLLRGPAQLRLLPRLRPQVIALPSLAALAAPLLRLPPPAC